MLPMHELVINDTEKTKKAPLRTAGILGFLLKRSGKMHKSMNLFQGTDTHIPSNGKFGKSSTQRYPRGGEICDRSQAGYVNIKELVRILGFFLLTTCPTDLYISRYEEMIMQKFMNSI